ncbi:hypothetical protein K488DRAFT_41545 [Vararia minispora EC-137]|uniref:Uncharacterized protein n=1 Tax=Vararia minispora EC-137 TaxID=1314806 RepID=A0ACB8QWK1_9AGAM|nr:hypothetical protein K488DRAFT_41545 [Vararia minispora EC-137]
MASYLPLLLSSVSTQHVPSDDTSLSTQARGQVDYLSHEWNEDDIARSWRNMTRQKNEIANGQRLENASWRTWWKQRNKLKTVSPETLNWLKDSDVTWLYGPLHTALDWSPPPKPAEDPTSVEKEHNTQDRLGLSCEPGPKKPILKHKTISELLLSALPPSYEEADLHDGADGFVEELEVAGPDQGRPPLLHTKSDTNVLKLARPQNPVRKDSPPRIIAETQEPAPDPVLGPELQRSASSDSATGSSDLNPPTKRHITFNTFVEQCIAIDSPPKQPKKPSPDTRWAQFEEEDDGSVSLLALRGCELR